MSTYRIDARMGPAARRPVERPRRCIGQVAASVAALLAVLGAAGYAWMNSPERVGERFLEGCRTRSCAALRDLMDDTYRQVFPSPASAELLRSLHLKIPRAYHVEAGGQPEINGLLIDRRRYHLRVGFDEPEEARRAHRSFVISLTQRADGAWRVAFLPTYRSLFLGLYGLEGEEHLERALWKRAGARIQSL